MGYGIPGGDIVGLAGVALDLSIVPTLQGPSALLSKPPKEFAPRPPVSEVNFRSADWLIGQLPVFSYFVEDDENYTPRFHGGSLEEMLGYSADDFINATTYKAPSAIYPPDQHFGDAHVTAAATRVGATSAVRERLVHKDGHEFPVLSVARGAQPDGRPVGAAGIVLDLTNVEPLQGNPGLLVP